LLTGTRLGDAGEVGRIAASVIDGVKILRIEDLQAEANSTTAARKGFVARLIGFAADAHSAFKGFAENRKRFLDLMDEEQARARKVKADLSVAVELMDQQSSSNPPEPPCTQDRDRRRADRAGPWLPGARSTTAKGRAVRRGC
jgi:hypothetical protein